MSDRLQWFASFVAIFRRKTNDEIAMDGEDFGTHKLLPIKTRYQGRDAAAIKTLVRRPVIEEHNQTEVHREEWVQNYLNFDVQNFAVQSRGSLHNIVNNIRQQFEVAEQRVTGHSDTQI